MSLVANYGTSSESSSESESDGEETKPQTEHPDKQTIEKESTEKLPGPNFDGSSTSVFSNPFIEAENEKKAILEKHVKMVPTKEDTKVINGKKICWNYRKGRCRFGHKCAFAHDSDLQRNTEELKEEPNAQNLVLSQTTNTSKEPVVETTTAVPQVQNFPQRKKKRPGLTQGLIPGKKVMKLFNKQQEKHFQWSTT